MKLSYFRDSVRIWNRKTFGVIQDCKKRLIAHLSGIQKSVQNTSNSFLFYLERLLDNTFAQEEMLWFQKSRT